MENKNTMEGPFSLNCSCNLPGHTLHFWYDPDNKDLSITVCMSPNAGIFKRIWTALKYVFWTRENLWEYSDTLLDKGGIKELQEYVNKCLEDCNGKN